MKEAKIIKFGTVCESKDGDLIFAHFHVDSGDRFEYVASDIAILTLVCERLGDEIARIQRERAEAGGMEIKYPRTCEESVKAALRELLDVERMAG